MIDATQTGRIGLILQLGDLLAKTADAVAKFGDSIAHLVALGAQGYDAAAARKAHADLINLRANLERMTSLCGPLIRSIKEYVQRCHQLPPEAPIISILWSTVVDKIEDTFVRSMVC
jgi:hypothetical protein